MSDAEVTPPRDPGAREALTAALRRTFAIYRLYGFTHEHALGAERDAFARISARLQDAGEVALEISPDGVQVDGHPLIPDGDAQLARVLYAEGVERIVMQDGLQQEALATLTRTWFEASTHRLGEEHSVATVLWEADLGCLEVQTRPVLAEAGVETEDARARQNQLAAYVRALTSREQTAQQPVRLDAGALEVMPALGGLEALDPEALAAAAARGRPELEPLSDVDRAALASGLAAHRRGAARRLILLLWRALSAAGPGEREAALTLGRRVIAGRLAAGRLDDVVGALTRVLELRDEEDAADADSVLGALTSPEVLPAIIERLGAAEAASAVTLLALVPRDRAAHLVRALSSAGAQARARLVEAVARKRPDPLEVAGWALEHGPDTWPALLTLAEQLDAGVEPIARDLVLRAGLAHADPEVRGLAARAVRTDEVGDHRTLLLDAARGADPATRQVILQSLVRAQEPIAAELLAQELADNLEDEAAARGAITGLAAFGGPEARRALLGALVGEGPQGVRAAAALALVPLADDAVLAALTERARRRWADREVREACQEALRRVEAAARSRPKGGKA